MMPKKKRVSADRKTRRLFSMFGGIVCQENQSVPAPIPAVADCQTVATVTNIGRSPCTITTNTSAIQTPASATVEHGDAYVSSIFRRIQFVSNAKRKAG